MGRKAEVVLNVVVLVTIMFMGTALECVASYIFLWGSWADIRSCRGV